MKAQPLVVHLPDTRGVEISPYGSGNLKLGFGVFTYSRLPGDPAKSIGTQEHTTCPGSTKECEAICYAKRVSGVVRDVWAKNSQTDEVPPIPSECSTLRIHVSGDFDSVTYIQNWIYRLTERPDVTAWVYTRSWRVPELLPALEALRALPNLQMFASMDPSCTDVPPKGWRRAWIWRDFDASVTGPWPMEERLMMFGNIGNDGKGYQIAQVKRPVDPKVILDALPGEHTVEQCPSYVCPEETGAKPNCMACGYCFEGQRNDVTFLEHGGQGWQG